MFPVPHTDCKGIRGYMGHIKRRNYRRRGIKKVVAPPSSLVNEIGGIVGSPEGSSADTPPVWNPDNAVMLKLAAEGSCFVFGRHIIGNEFIVPHVHGEIDKWLNGVERERSRWVKGVEIKGRLSLVLVPRDCLKSTFLSSIYSIWHMVKNPDIRILIDSESRDLSKAILKNIKDTITNCELLKALWGDLKGAEVWNLENMRVSTRKDFKAKEDTVETSGIDVAVTGRHYDRIVIDDIHSERNVRTKEQIDKVKEHIQLMMPLLETGGEMCVVGTRWADDDAYDWITSLKDDNGDGLFDVFCHSAYNDDGTAYYPERNSLPTLALKKATMSEALFSCQFLLDPIPESIAPLKKTNLKYIETDKIPLNLNKFMMCDTIGDKKTGKGDYFAVTTWGIEPQINELGLCNLYLLDGLCGWFDTEQQIQAICNLYLKTRPIEFGIEKSGMNTLHVHLTNNLSSKGLHLVTTELKPSGRSKEQRVLQFIPYIQNSLIHINKSCNEHFLEEFLNEWSRFPRARRDDCVDASAYIFDFLAKYPLALYGTKKKKQTRETYNWKTA